MVPDRFDGARDHGGNFVAEFGADAADGDEAGFDVARVLTGFEQQNVGAAIKKAASLDGRNFRSSSLNVTPPVTVMALVVGPMEPATKSGLEGVAISSATLRARLAAATLSSYALAGNGVFGENQRGGTEAVGFNDV